MNEKIITSELQKIWTELQKLWIFIKSDTRNTVMAIIGILLVIGVIIMLRHMHIRNQYSDEAWKIVKKNGRKAIFWYDEYGNKTYKKPKAPRKNRY